MGDGERVLGRDKPPMSWWLAAAVGAPVLNFLTLFGVLAGLGMISPLFIQLWWLVAIVILAFEYRGFRTWGDRLGLGRGWAIAGAGIGVALGVALATLVLFILLSNCDGCFN